MTSVFLVRDDHVLLLFRRNSRAIPDSWVGIGGHVEPAELGDPTAAVRRELYEEVGLTADDLSGLAFRYVALRDSGIELRITYYFEATLRASAPAPTECPEGELRWFDLAEDHALEMPPTARVAFDHWRRSGRFDELIRSVVMSSDGPVVLPLAY
jgi:8-oxo-dGTP diphosphatase